MIRMVRFVGQAAEIGRARGWSRKTLKVTNSRMIEVFGTRWINRPVTESQKSIVGHNRWTQSLDTIVRQ